MKNLEKVRKDKMVWYIENYNYGYDEREGITITCNKCDSDGVLISKIKQALQKTGSDASSLNECFQKLKKHKSVTIFY